MVKEVPAADRKSAIDLVNAVFTEFVAIDYAEQGRRTFEAYLESKLQTVSADLEAGHKKMWAYYQGDTILGVIATQDRSHISLMFVDSAHHRKGIAKKLFQTVLEELGEDKDVTQIT
ncbi:MAG: GNAT family N-acetyltransferase, partial [Oscillospiraceae bacterium]|nr:GNAT family N-acetyltransferase [Oscillospiraceae bacterium]